MLCPQWTSPLATSTQPMGVAEGWGSVLGPTESVRGNLDDPTARNVILQEHPVPGCSLLWSDLSGKLLSQHNTEWDLYQRKNPRNCVWRSSCCWVIQTENTSNTTSWYPQKWPWPTMSYEGEPVQASGNDQPRKLPCSRFLYFPLTSPLHCYRITTAGQSYVFLINTMQIFSPSTSLPSLILSANVTRILRYSSFPVFCRENCFTSKKVLYKLSGLEMCF